MSRWLSPGECGRHRGGLQNGTQFHNRVYIGKIIHVDPTTGVMRVQVGAAQKEEPLVIPLPGLSVKGFKSSWMRYMPQQGDYVKIAYGADNQPHCVGMAVWGHGDLIKSSTNKRRVAGQGYHVSGYANLAELQRRPAPGLREFTTLKPGEWDMRSSGNAYIKGSNQGTLLLSGGTTKVELDKQRNEVRTRATTTVISDGGSNALRFGNVRRLLAPTDFSSSEVAVSPLQAKEFAIHVETLGSIPTGEDGAVDVRYGNVWNDGPLSTEARTVAGQPIRVRGAVTGSVTTGSLDLLTWEVDALGNVEVSGLTADMTTSFLNANHSALTEFNVTSPATTVEGTATLDLTGAAINLNALGTADQQLPRGNALLDWVADLIEALNNHTHIVTQGPTTVGTAGPVIANIPPSPFIGPVEALVLSATAKVK